MFDALRHQRFPLFTRGPIKRCCSGDTRGERTNQTTVPENFPLPELPSEPPLMETRLILTPKSPYKTWLQRDMPFCAYIYICICNTTMYLNVCAGNRFGAVGQGHQTVRSAFEPFWARRTGSVGPHWSQTDNRSKTEYRYTTMYLLRVELLLL